MRQEEACVEYLLISVECHLDWYNLLSSARNLKTQIDPRVNTGHETRQVSVIGLPEFRRAGL